MKKLLVLICLLFYSFTVTMAQTQDWEKVEKILGKKGTANGNTFKIIFPRFDLNVKVGNIPVEAGLALTSWIGFQPIGNTAMIMGDLVILDREVSPVMTKLLSEGIQVTALHNHLIGESPPIKYMHFSANGEPADLAQKIKAALALTKTSLTSPQAKKSFVNWKTVELILGRAGKTNGNLLQVSVPRIEAITEHGIAIPPSMGTATAINFQRVGTKAATAGDFVLLAGEVEPVAQALTEHGIAVTAIHNHMLLESPRLFMLHFWGVGTPDDLAQGVRNALEQTNSVK